MQLYLRQVKTRNYTGEDFVEKSSAKPSTDQTEPKAAQTVADSVTSSATGSGTGSSSSGSASPSIGGAGSSTPKRYVPKDSVKEPPPGTVDTTANSYVVDPTAAAAQSAASSSAPTDDGASPTSGDSNAEGGDSAASNVDASGKAYKPVNIKKLAARAFGMGSAIGSASHNTTSVAGGTLGAVNTYGVGGVSSVANKLMAPTDGKKEDQTGEPATEATEDELDIDIDVEDPVDPLDFDIDVEDPVDPLDFDVDVEDPVDPLDFDVDVDEEPVLDTTKKDSKPKRSRRKAGEEPSENVATEKKPRTSKNKNVKLILDESKVTKPKSSKKKPASSANKPDDSGKSETDSTSSEAAKPSKRTSRKKDAASPASTQDDKPKVTTKRTSKKNESAVSTNTEEAKPKAATKRTSRKKTEEAAASADVAEANKTEAAAPAPKRTTKKKEEAASPDTAQEAKPKATAKRTSKKKEEPAAPDAAQESKPKATRRTTKKKEEAASPTASDATQEAKPKATTKRTTKKTTKKEETPTGEDDITSVSVAAVKRPSRKKKADGSTSASKKESNNTEKSFVLYIDLTKAVQIPNVSIDSTKDPERRKREYDTSFEEPAIGVSGGPPAIVKKKDEDDSEAEDVEKSLNSSVDYLGTFTNMVKSLAGVRTPAMSPYEKEFLKKELGYSEYDIMSGRAVIKGIDRIRFSKYVQENLIKSISSLKVYDE